MNMDDKAWSKFSKKMKKIFNTVNKYNISSPCLLQLLEHRRTKELEIIVTHRDVLKSFDPIKALSIATKDSFYINKDDDDFEKNYNLDYDASRYSPVLCISTKPVHILYENQSDYICSEEYYCFHKIVLKLISDDLLRNIDLTYKEATGKYEVGFITDESVDIRYPSPFIQNTLKLDNLFKLKIFPPIESKGVHADMIVRKYNDCDNILSYDSDHLKELLEENEGRFFIRIKRGDTDIVLHHTDFIRINPLKLEVIKKHIGDNIARIILDMESKDVSVILEYRYIEVGDE